MVIPALVPLLESAPSEEISNLAFEAAQLCDEWDRHLDRADSRARRQVTDSLALLRSCKDESELSDSICFAAASAFGARWALAARVETDTWSLWQAHEESPSRRSARSVDDSEPLPLGDLRWESEIVHTALPLRLTDPLHLAVLPGPVRVRTREDGVRIAPMPVAGRVAALLYVPERRSSPATEHDELGGNLDTFASGVGAVLERELLYERFRTQRVHIRNALASMDRTMASLDTGVDLVRLVGRKHADTVASVGFPLVGTTPAWNKQLTPREHDVMAMVALGRSNSEIAHDLVLSQNTVKSHLRNIMRKVGAVNRTELISLHREA
ncbi:hypothetical protein ASG90_01365 [Nocardioides sp. Soil797]|nr:hypothetical protein ASG90_01365 [Nocardioides sp. Soil797]